MCVFTLLEGYCFEFVVCLIPRKKYFHTGGGARDVA